MPSGRSWTSGCEAFEKELGLRKSQVARVCAVLEARTRHWGSGREAETEFWTVPRNTAQEDHKWKVSPLAGWKGILPVCPSPDLLNIPSEKSLPQFLAKGKKALPCTVPRVAKIHWGYLHSILN